MAYRHPSICFICSIVLRCYVILLIANNAYAVSLESFLSPGPNIEGHKKYEDDCSNCHEKFSKKGQTPLCLDCHKKVNADIKNNTGFHGRNKVILKSECSTCHTEHKGRDANIAQFDTTTFNHTVTDFPLAGAHLKLACASCHKPKEKYRDAPTKCITCHESDSPHQGRLGDQCEDCHNEKRWSEIRYDHDKTNFPLRNAHKKIECNNCHPNDRYKNLPQDCYACHALNDAHDGEFGQKCDTCHGTKGWKVAAFNHDKETDFPLKGEHKELDCRSCHLSDPKKVKLKTDCYACHKKQDEHKAFFGPKCNDCHTEYGWSKSIFDHNKDTNYTLRGKHVDARCTGCHKSNPYKENLSKQCNLCHLADDVHNGKQGKQCEKCHNEQGWSGKVRFEHDITRFPLLGLHATLPCEECHLDTNYSNTSSTCYACHKLDDTHKQTLGKKCEQCHNPNGWQFWTFDHDKDTDYKLAGAHKNLICSACHRTPTDKIKLVSTCVACHRVDDVHRGQFGFRCENCHGLESFSDLEIRR